MARKCSYPFCFMRKKSKRGKVRTRPCDSDPQLPALIRARGEVTVVKALTAAVIVACGLATLAGSFDFTVFCLLYALKAAIHWGRPPKA